MTTTNEKKPTGITYAEGVKPETKKPAKKTTAKRTSKPKGKAKVGRARRKISPSELRARWAREGWERLVETFLIAMIRAGKTDVAEMHESAEKLAGLVVAGAKARFPEIE